MNLIIRQHGKIKAAGAAITALSGRKDRTARTASGSQSSFSQSSLITREHFNRQTAVQANQSQCFRKEGFYHATGAGALRRDVSTGCSLYSPPVRNFW
jgi:hypothetical protein